jgi:hypothetical protein
MLAALRNRLVSSNPRDLCRQAKLIDWQKPHPQFEAEVQALMPRLEKARDSGLAPPDRGFKKSPAENRGR